MVEIWWTLPGDTLIKAPGPVALEAGRNVRPRFYKHKHREGNVTLDRMRIKSKASDAATGANVYRRRTQPSRVSRLTAG